MCGVVGLHLRDAALQPLLGEMLAAMTGQLCERGPDSAGFAVYGDPELTPPGTATVSVLPGTTGDPAAAAVAVSDALPGVDVTAGRRGQSLLVHAAIPADQLAVAVRSALPGVVLSGLGDRLAVLKGVGDPRALAAAADLPAVSGYQGLAHTRMATESAVTAAHCHPFSVGTDLAFVHNGSFANHATIRRQLQADGVVFDSDNDSEVGARFLAARLDAGDDLDKALRVLTEAFDGFYTLLVATSDALAVVRDRVACKPCLVAEGPGWVAMASEYRALAQLPDLARARIREPEPEQVLSWSR